MFRAMRPFLVLLFVAILTLIAASPAAASGPQRRAPTTPLADEPSGSVEPTGVTACDVKLSTEDGPLVDANFQVRVWEPFIVWGFGYPVDTDITIEFFRADAAETFPTTTDSAGEFAEGLFFFTPDSPAPGWSVTAEPTAGGCQDSIALTILAPYPFTDIDGFENEIAWLYREGITGGCTATRFCPDNGVTRGQMAAFLNRALGLPGTTTDFFDDDDGTMFEGDINRLAASGITGGCDTRRFCPNSLVSREQMASFLTRAFGLPGSSTDFFSDDNTSIHEGSINALAASGITGGCATGRFCPKSNVTREQMAAFLYRAFN